MYVLSVPILMPGKLEQSKSFDIDLVRSNHVDFQGYYQVHFEKHKIHWFT